MLCGDLADLRQTLCPKLHKLPDPAITLQDWTCLARDLPHPWKLLVKAFVTAKVCNQEALWQMGIRNNCLSLESEVLQSFACSASD